jgi:hypothetical protein
MTGDPVRLPLDRLVFLRNVPAGMDWAVIGFWVCRFRKTADPCDPPIDVVPDGHVYRVTDGRHRTMAAYIAGRTSIAAHIRTG